MSEPDDEYLWTGEGPVSLEVAKLERELRVLRFAGGELRLPGQEAVTVVEARPRASVGRRRWPAFAAGFAAALALLAALSLLRGQPDRAPEPEDGHANPAATTSPDLKDPFASSRSEPEAEPPEGPGSGEPGPDLVDPFATDGAERPSKRRVSPDLKDPFKRAPDEPRAPGPDLVDPFSGGSSEQADPSPPPAKDPFQGKNPEPKRVSPDLKDPFSRSGD